MKKSAMCLAAAAIAAGLSIAPASSHAVCGDVSGNDSIEASDALRVLRASVGLEVELTCEIEPLRHSEARLYNALNCPSGSDKAVLETDDGPTSQKFTVNDPDDYSDYQVLNSATIDDFDYSWCEQEIHFNGAFNIPPERKLTYYVSKGDPSFYGQGVYFLQIDDEGPRSGAPPSEELVFDGQTIGLVGRSVADADGSR